MFSFFNKKNPSDNIFTLGGYHKLPEPDQQVILALIKAGSILTLQHHIDHFFYTDNQEVAFKVEEFFKEKGYEVKVNPPDKNIFDWSISVHQLLIPNAENILNNTRLMQEVVNKFSVVYDGWDSDVILN